MFVKTWCTFQPDNQSRIRNRLTSDSGWWLTVVHPSLKAESDNSCVNSLIFPMFLLGMNLSSFGLANLLIVKKAHGKPSRHGNSGPLEVHLLSCPDSWPYKVGSPLCNDLWCRYHLVPPGVSGSGLVCNSTSSHKADMFCLSPCLSECRPGTCLSRVIEFLFLQLMYDSPLTRTALVWCPSPEGETESEEHLVSIFFEKKIPWQVPWHVTSVTWIHDTTTRTVTRAVREESLLLYDRVGLEGYKSRSDFSRNSSRSTGQQLPI